MTEIKISYWHGYSETAGTVTCVECGADDLWCNIPVEGDKVECDDCGCQMVFVDDEEI